MNIDLNDPDLTAFVKKATSEELDGLADVLRRRIISVVGKNGGHLASSLGAVELCIALHRVFDLKRDPVFFDVGHQAYAHKLLTGRTDMFDNLRRADGCSGFPSRFESDFDPAAAGHAGVAVSLALGRAAAKSINDDPGVAIAVVGDGSMSCGVSFEGLNAAKACGRKLIVILNDNQMAISPNVGGLSRCLNRVISGRRYNLFRKAVKAGLRNFAGFNAVKRFINRIEDIIKGMLLPPGVLFQELGLRYIGPVDGNDLSKLLPMLDRVSRIEGPVLLHVTTRKGRGYAPAEKSPQDFHGVSGFDVSSGKLPVPSEDTFSTVFGRCMVSLAAEDDSIETVSAAMISGTGLLEFSRRYPERCHDVGIAEEHAAVFASGLASGGRKPVCAMYSTFLQRAFDCIYCEVILNRFPVVFAIDRAGVVEDGSTHHGIYDLGFLRQLPDFPIFNPARPEELEVMLKMALDLNAPCAIRYPRGAGAKRRENSKIRIAYGKNHLVQSSESDIVIWALGAEIDTALSAAALLDEKVNVVLVHFIAPFDKVLAEELRYKRHFTIEDHCVRGGLYSTLCETLADGPHGSITPFGWSSDAVIGHGTVTQLRSLNGLDAENIAVKIKEQMKTQPPDCCNNK